MERVIAQLKDVALAYFAAEHVTAHIEGDEIVTERGRYGLVNLAQHLRQAPGSHWEAKVRAHFDRLRSVSVDVPETYYAARSRLRVRLAAVDTHGAVTRSVTDSLHEVLMLKIPEGGMSVTDRALATWNVNIDQIWHDARAHTRWDEPHESSILKSPAGDEYTRVEGSFWSSSLLLDLGETVPESQMTAGTLAIIPRQDLLVFRTLDHAPPWTDLLTLSVAMFELGPGSITPDVFWWHSGTVERVIEWKESGPVPRWSERFRTAIDGLKPAA